MKKPFDPDVPFGEEPAPLVDDALAATDRSAADHEELRALKSEVARLRATLKETASGAARVAMDEMQARIREQPLVAATVVAVVAFFYGVTR